jgi:hypothetical protein
MQVGLPVFKGKFHGLQGAASQMLADAENHGGIRIPNIPFGSLGVIAAGRLVQLILGIDWTILSSPPLWTPASMCDAVFYGPIQSRTISAGLSIRNYFLNHRNCLHCISISVETAIRGKRNLRRRRARPQIPGLLTTSK